MSKKIKVYIETCRSSAKIPVYAYAYDAGMDIYAAEKVFIKPQETKMVPTGFKVAIPQGYEIQIRPRSGISFRTPLRLANTPGTIDAGYRDEIGILVTNTSIEGEKVYSINEKSNQQGIYVIEKGDRIAQMVLARVPKIEFESVKDVSLIGDDRGGGFGSTGTT